MLEVVNGFLLVYFVALCVINTLLPYLVKLIGACFMRPSKVEKIVWVDLLKLRTEQKGVSMKDEFAAYSKLQRKINKLENQLKENSHLRRTKIVAIKNSLKIGLQAFLALIIVSSVIWYRREPVVLFKSNLFPLSTILKYPSELPNAISTQMWVLICNISIRALLKPIVSS